MNQNEIKAIETLRALDGKIIKKYIINNTWVAAFSEAQAMVLYRKHIIRKKEIDVGIIE